MFCVVGAASRRLVAQITGGENNLRRLKRCAVVKNGGVRGETCLMKIHDWFDRLPGSGEVKRRVRIN